MLRRFYCRCWHRWGGLPPLLPAYPAFSLLYRPHPPDPLPLRGRGRLKVYFAGGFAPGTPALNRLQHLQTPPEQVHGGTTRREPIPVGFAANHGFSPGDARGKAPCIRKLKISPFPPGRGSGGWGQQSKLKAGLAGDKEGTPPAGDSGGKVSRRPAGQSTRRARGSPLSTVPPGAPLQPNHAGITCCFGDNITKIP